MAEEEPSAVAELAKRLIDRVVDVGINGGGPLQGAVAVAEEHLRGAGGDREEAVRRLVATHVRLAAVSGFVTGVGGFATLPVAVPAATAGLQVGAAGRGADRGRGRRRELQDDRHLRAAHLSARRPGHPRPPRPVTWSSAAGRRRGRCRSA